MGVEIFGKSHGGCGPCVTVACSQKVSLHLCFVPTRQRSQAHALWYKSLQHLADMISAGSLPTHKAMVRLHTDSDEHKQECRNGTGHYFPKRKSLDEIRHWFVLSPVCVCG